MPSIIKGSIIISETDLHGTILFVNQPFCYISGFSNGELVGSPHNIIRHPSMPKELFQLLWATIKRGEVFRAVIKNKKKDGDFFWVNATIMPVIEGGKIRRYVGGSKFIPDVVVAESLFEGQLSRLKLR